MGAGFRGSFGTGATLRALATVGAGLARRAFAPLVNGLTQLVMLSLAVTEGLASGSIAAIGAKRRVS